MNLDDIKYLVGMIMEEISGKETYEKNAKKWEKTLPEASKMFMTMAEQEKHHGGMILEILKMVRTKETNDHTQVVLDFVIDIANEQLNK